MNGRYFFRRMVLVSALALSAALVALPQAASAVGLRVVPSSSRVAPGEDFTIDVFAENIPVATGLGAVQFRLNVAATGERVDGVLDLGQAPLDAVSVVSPLLISPSTTTRSGLGAFFLGLHQGSNGILVIENESLKNGSALYTYAHTAGASLPSGSGVVARFQAHVGKNVKAAQAEITLSDVLLISGDLNYPLDSITGARIVLDVIPPKLSVNPVTTPSNQNLVVLSGTVEAGAEVSVFVAKTAQYAAVTMLSAVNWNATITDLGEGLNTFLVTATDVMENKTERPVELFVDTLAPVVIITSPSDEVPTKLPILEYTVSDGVVTVTVDNQATILNSGDPLVNLSDGPHTVKVESVDAVGNNGSDQVTFTVDTLPPVVGINPVVTPTNLESQLLSGIMESGATVDVTIDTMAMAGAVSYPTTTTWECTISGLAPADNTVTVTARDAADNGTATSVTINFDPPMAVRVTPTAIDAPYQGLVQVVISNLATPGATVYVEQLIDANRNGMVDDNEPLIRAFRVTDGVSSLNPNLQQDEDGMVDASITTRLAYYNRLDEYHASGQTLFRVSTETESAAAGFAVTPVSAPQTIAGTVSNATGPVPGAWVELTDKWQRPMAWTIADPAGHYVFNVGTPGAYTVVPRASGYATARATLPQISLAAGANLTVDLDLVAGLHHVVGQVYDEVSATGIAGMLVEAAGAEHFASALTDASGNYALALPEGEYSVQVKIASAIGPSGKGYVGASGQTSNINLSGDLTGINFPLAPAAVLVSGKVLDADGNGMAGIPVQGGMGVDPLAYAVSAVDGSYTMALKGGADWSLGLDDHAGQRLGLVGTVIENFSTSNGPLTGNDLTARGINAWVEGRVTNAAEALLAGIVVKLRNADSTMASMTTALDGTYRLGIFGSDWLGRAMTETQGYRPTIEQSVSLAAGETTIVDFVAQPNILQYTVSTSVEGNGTLSCNSPVTSGTPSVCNVTPASGYYLATISGCGAGTQNGNQYTTAAIDSDCTVSAAFAVLTPVTAVSLSALPTKSIFVSGPVVTLNANATGVSGNYEYQFILKSPGQTTGVQVQAFSSKSYWEWTTSGLPVGLYTVTVNARNAGSTALYEASKSVIYTLVTESPVTAVSLSALPTKIIFQSGPIVTLNAGATGTFGDYVYRFYLTAPGKAAVQVQAFSADSSWEWNTAGLAAGLYTVTAYAKNAGSVANYEAALAVTYTVVDAPPVTAVSLSALPTKTVFQGGPLVTLNATATGTSGNYEYQFKLKAPGQATAIEVQAFSSDNSWEWTTSGLPMGFYTVTVNAKTTGSVATSEASVSVVYTVVDAPPVTAVSQSALPTKTIFQRGPLVTVNASATGTTDDYVYKFYLKAPGLASVEVRPFSADNSWEWNTEGLAAGLYTVTAYAKNASSVAYYEASLAVTYTVVDAPPVTAVSQSALPTKTLFQRGPLVTVNSSATGTTGDYVYQFHLTAPGQSRVKVQEYSSNSSWAWDTAGLAPGVYLITVYAKNSGSVASYEAYRNVYYTVVEAPPVTAVSLTAQSTLVAFQAGQIVNFSSLASGGNGAYEYRFDLVYGGVATVLQGYSLTNTLAWNTQGLLPGSYTIKVYARTVGSIATSEASYGKGYAIVTDPLVSSVTLTANPVGTTFPVGQVVTFFATASGGSGTYEYQFRLIYGGVVKEVLLGYSTANSCVWNTQGLTPGSYYVSVLARNVGSLAVWEAEKSTGYYTIQ